VHVYPSLGNVCVRVRLYRLVKLGCLDEATQDIVSSVSSLGIFLMQMPRAWRFSSTTTKAKWRYRLAIASILQGAEDDLLIRFPHASCILASFRSLQRNSICSFPNLDDAAFNEMLSVENLGWELTWMSPFASVIPSIFSLDSLSNLILLW
jgi:hypothetical protein